jgi:rhodanese-related sulfurtransferase
MKRLAKIYWLLIALTIAVWGGVENRYPTLALINSGIKVIDIRTEGEWSETGILKGSYPITFFDERGGYDVAKFLGKLNRVVESGEKFALICRTGSRTRTVSSFLARNGYSVINLQGGILHAIKKLGIRTERYNRSKRYY